MKKTESSWDEDVLSHGKREGSHGADVHETPGGQREGSKAAFLTDQRVNSKRLFVNKDDKAAFGTEFLHRIRKDINKCLVNLFCHLTH